jgi:hypothetical protein
VDRFIAPSNLDDLRRVEVRGSTIYLSGYGPGARWIDGEVDNWKWSGKRMVKYNSPLGEEHGHGRRDVHCASTSPLARQRPSYWLGN